MSWAEVRLRYLANYRGPDSGVLWHLMVGYYVTDRWLAEATALNGAPYDVAVTDPVWDSQFSLDQLNILDAAAAAELERYVELRSRTGQAAVDKAVVLKALKEFGVADAATVRKALKDHGSLDADGLSRGLKANDKYDRGWLIKTMAEGPISALGVILFGLAVTGLSALYSPPAKSALADLFGSAGHILGIDKLFNKAPNADTKPARSVSEPRRLK